MLVPAKSISRSGRVGADLQLERSLATVLISLLQKISLSSFATCVPTRLCVDGGRVFNGNVRIMFLILHLVAGKVKS